MFDIQKVRSDTTPSANKRWPAAVCRVHGAPEADTGYFGQDMNRNETEMYERHEEETS